MNKEIDFNEFIWFLKDNGVYTSFLRNFKSQTELRLSLCNIVYQSYFFGLVDKTLIDYYAKIISRKDIFILSFEWDDTKEGFDFWKKISDEYSNYLRKR